MIELQIKPQFVLIYEQKHTVNQKIYHARNNHEK